MLHPESTASFGYWVRRQRLALDLTQADLARAVGCATVTISKIERDERRPSRQMAELLAQHLAVPTEEQDRFVAAALGERATERMPLPNQPRVTAMTLPRPDLVGRSRERAEVARLLRENGRRLVSLTGPGGVGKTSLATQILQDVADDYADGCHIVMLALVRESGLVLSTIARSMGLREAVDGRTAALLAASLGDAHVLLMLDNFEQVLGAALDVNALLHACPNLQVLVTSRERLHLRVETEYRLDPLPVTTAQGVTGSDLDHLPEAVEMFVRCAQAVQPAFRLDADNIALVTELCARLDGLPLALELAAARLRRHGLPTLLARLTAHRTGLSSRLQDIPERHRSLYAAIAWSYDLLTDMEQRLFRLLSVFAGGAEFSAVKEVVDLEEEVVEELVDSLIDKSLVRSEITAVSVSERLIMLETVREFGLEMLAATDELVQAQQAHAEWVRAFVNEVDPQVIGWERTGALARFELERANVHRALVWLVANGELETAMEIAGHAALFWETRGYLTEGYELLSLIINAARSLPQSAEKANVLLRAAICHGYRPPLDRTDRLLQEALEAAYQADAADVIVESLNRLASMADIQGRQEQRLALLEEFAREVDRTGTRSNIKGFSHLATAYAVAGRFEDAHAASARAESMLTERGDPRIAGIIMRDRADILWREGRMNEARSAFARALDLSQEAGDPNAWSACLFKAGRFYTETGDFSAASDALRASIEMRKTTEQPYWALEAVDQFALLLHARGAYADALLVARAGAHLKGDSGVAGAENELTSVHWDAVLTEAEQDAITLRAARMSFDDLFAFIAAHA